MNKKKVIKEDVKYYLTLIQGVSGFVLIWLSFLLGKIIPVDFLPMFGGLGLFLILFFIFDKVVKLTFKPKTGELAADLVNLLPEVKDALKGAKAVKDIDISVAERVKVDTEVRPKILKLEAVLKKVEVLAVKADKRLKGPVAAKSDASGNMTVERKQEE